MAWQAIITGWDLDAVSVSVGYYDDTDPANTPTPSVFLYSRTFSRTEVDSLNGLRRQVIVVGQQKRQAYNQFVSLQAAGSIGIP